MNRTTAKLYLDGAPKETKHVDGLLGFWLKDGYYICSDCAARIMARGCGGFVGADPVWKDEAKPVGVCVGCGVDDLSNAIVESNNPENRFVDTLNSHQ